MKPLPGKIFAVGAPCAESGSKVESTGSCHGLKSFGLGRSLRSVTQWVATGVLREADAGAHRFSCQSRHLKTPLRRSKKEPPLPL